MSRSPVALEINLVRADNPTLQISNSNPKKKDILARGKEIRDVPWTSTDGHADPLHLERGRDAPSSLSRGNSGQERSESRQEGGGGAEAPPNQGGVGRKGMGGSSSDLTWDIESRPGSPIAWLHPPAPPARTRVEAGGTDGTSLNPKP